MKKAINWIFLALFFLIPIFWGIIAMDYSTWKAYKKAGYNVPNRFLKYLYQRHYLPYVGYKRP